MSFQSSPLSSLQSSPLSNSTRPRSPTTYRSQKALPFELREHCLVYFEETLYNQALNLVISLLTQDVSSSQTSPAFLPPSQHLALISTLIVHPTLTTRAKKVDQLHASNTALRYLRLVHSILGPINANFNEAFAYVGLTTSRRSASVRRRTAGQGTSPDSLDVDSINLELAHSEGIWERAEDFWHIVGWAFNCSILHKRRWERWRVWLDFMVQVLEDDWDLRQSISVATDIKNEEDPLQNSLIVKYLSSGGGKERRTVRSIFADADPRSVVEFKEIWKNETRERKKDSDATIKKSIKVNTDEGDYGDWLDEDDDLDMEDGQDAPEQDQSLPISEEAASSISNGTEDLGGVEAMKLRVRLLALLSSVSATLPDNFTSLGTLYELFLDHIRPMPIATFFAFMSPNSLRILTPAAASSLTQYILRPIISSAAPLPTKDDLTQETLERSFLPFAANTGNLADNSKVSLCVETLLRLWNSNVGLEWSESLQQAVELGINERDNKARRDGRKKGRDGGDVDRSWLRGSAERMKCLVEMARLESHR